MFRSIRSINSTIYPIFNSDWTLQRIAQNERNCFRQFSFTSKVEDRYYTKKHEWIELDKHVKGEIGTVGITDFAQQSLGDVVYVELPEVGTQLAKDDTAGAIESVKAASDLYSPVSGEVVELNTEVQDKPQLVNKFCFEKGWLYKLKIVDPSELSQLMDEKTYEEYEASESNS
uniref:Glycine cleavage system H protein n=1 Tax=Meloidogyne incognita TaxID=6306 RepID=A0A914LN49_MELIC